MRTVHYTSPVALLNLDAGERDDETEELWAPCDLLAIACGGHAGDERSMARVVAYCARRGRPAIGAHPSYPDREGFGRRTIEIGPQALRDSVAAQCASLAKVAAAHGARVQYVKPHGALYHRVMDDEEQAAAVLAGSGDLPVLGMPGAFLTLAAAAGRPVFHEGFPDRGYTPDGRLLPRSEPGALVATADEVVAQALTLAGTVDSLCLHGDSPGAVAHATAVRHALGEAGVSLQSFV